MVRLSPILRVACLLLFVSSAQVRAQTGEEAPSPAQPTPAQPSEVPELDYEALLRDQASILEELDQLDKTIEKLETELEQLQDQRQGVAVALIRLEVAFEGATDALVRTRDMIRKRLGAYLAADRIGRLEAALDPESAVEGKRRQRVIEHLLAADRERVKAYRERLESWRADRGVLRAKREELDSLEATLAATKGDLVDRRDRRAEILERINSDRRFFEKAHADAEKAHQALSDRIRKLEVWRDKSLRFGAHKGQFRLPMSYAKIVTPFGTRKNAKLGTTTIHPGMEIASDGSTSVRAIYWGRVAFIGWLLGYGTTIIVDHTEGYHSVYARMDDVEVKVGDVVESRQVLGTVGGASALGTPNTLLFELRHEGKAIDPDEWFR